MVIYFQFFAYFLFLVLINFFLIKKNFLIDLPNVDKHKKKIFFSHKVPKSLGLIIFLFVSFNLNFDIYEIYLIFFIFLLGILSDIKKLNSPKLRFFFQSIIVFIFLIYSGDFIQTTKVPFIDHLLNFKFFSILLTLFCILIVINGSNFIDGLNTLCVGYYLSLAVILLFFQLDNIYIFENIYLFISILFLTYLFNFFGKSFLGDSGSYLVGFLFSILLIDLHVSKINISPWFIAVLLWYPAFEILFSIIRRSIKSKNPFLPDNRHFHQLLYLYFKKRYNFKTPFINPLTANVINLYNFFIFCLAYKYYNFSIVMIIIFFFNCLTYLILYLILNKNISK